MSYKHSKIAMISILVLFLVGVASPRHISYYDNDSEARPIISKAQERRICAELCMSGLGGEPCGEECVDVIPQGLPTASQFDPDSRRSNLTRNDACPLLCANRLGYPLCDCDYTHSTTPFFKANFPHICLHFCTAYKYRIYGCDECDEYANMSQAEKSTIMGVAGLATWKKTYDWNAWCESMCQQGDGGSACYCDLLPLTLKI